MMDEAFRPFHELLAALMSFGGEIVDEDAGVRSHVYEGTIELPVELDVGRDEHGGLQIGSTPPLYYVDTTVRPSFHKLRVTMEANRHDDGDR